MIPAALHNAHLPGDPFRLPGDGPDAALLYHGFTATPNEVLGLGQALQAAGISAYGPLLAGHGTHPRDLNRVRWQDWTSAALQTFDELAARHRRVIVGGESNGGLLALYVSALRPQAAAVLAYAPALVIPLSPVERILLRVLAVPGVLVPKGNNLRGNMTWQGYRYNPARAVLQLRHFQAEVRRLLPEVCAPALIAQGGRDGTVDPLGAQEVYERIGSKVKALRWYADAPHCLLLAKEKPAVIAATLEFLREAGLLGRA